MKRSFVLAAFSILYLIGHSQTLKFVIFSGGSELSSLAYMTNQRIIIKISQDGNVQEWGNEQEAGRFYSEPWRLQPYMGRIEYFEKQFDSILNGKIRSIGVTSITYYGSTENAALVGKVKSIGNIFFNYYLDLENESLRGKIKTAGQKNLSYYTSFDNEAYRGKIKSIGGTQVSYYSTFDDVSIRGKLKSLGSHNFTWYTSLDRQGYQGGLKSGPRYPVIEGATYVIL
ncbi:MAG TPA: hypothetical protein VF144_17990 [Chitinophagaceae bacterium]